MIEIPKGCIDNFIWFAKIVELGKLNEVFSSFLMHLSLFVQILILWWKWWSHADHSNKTNNR